MNRLFRAAGVSLLVGIAVPAPASATIVWPGSEAYTVEQTAELQLESNAFEVECAVSTLTDVMPAEPDNEVPDEPITVDVDTPTVDDCEGVAHIVPFGEVAIDVTVTPNDENGSWQMTYDNDGSAPIHADLVVPEDGVVVTIDSPACEYNVAPSSPATLEGEWTNGTDSEGDPSTLEYDAVSVPVELESGTCPSASTASVTGAYEARNDTLTTEPTLVQQVAGIKWRVNNADYDGAVAASGTGLAFRWSSGGNNYHVTCDWSGTGSVTNTSALRTGVGTLTMTFANCTSALPANCTFGSFARSGDWAIKGEKLNNAYRFRILGSFLLTTSGMGCSLAASTTWNPFGLPLPTWTNGAAPALSTIGFPGDNSVRWRIGSTFTPQANVLGSMTLATDGGATITMIDR